MDRAAVKLEQATLSRVLQKNFELRQQTREAPVVRQQVLPASIAKEHRVLGIPSHVSRGSERWLPQEPALPGCPFFCFFGRLLESSFRGIWWTLSKVLEFFFFRGDTCMVLICLTHFSQLSWLCWFDKLWWATYSCFADHNK